MKIAIPGKDLGEIIALARANPPLPGEDERAYNKRMSALAAEQDSKLQTTPMLVASSIAQTIASVIADVIEAIPQQGDGKAFVDIELTNGQKFTLTITAKD